MKEKFERTPDGHVNNCALANGDSMSNCQVCAGRCPDQAEFGYDDDGQKELVKVNGDRPISETNPKHYRLHPSGIEAIDVCEQFDFCVGNALKYLFRLELKDTRLSNLKKAQWYIERATEKDGGAIWRGGDRVRQLIAQNLKKIVSDDDVLGRVCAILYACAISQTLGSIPVDKLHHIQTEILKEIVKTQAEMSGTLLRMAE